MKYLLSLLFHQYILPRVIVGVIPLMWGPANADKQTKGRNPLCAIYIKEKRNARGQERKRKEKDCWNYPN